jgi:hypothetical protein
MNYGERLALLIDAAFATEVNKNEKPFRTHLGASVIGDSCQRKIWYGFRWYDKENHSGQLLRLFERGQLEEERFTKLLRLIGATVFTHDVNGKQFRISKFGGHFGGSTDGVAVELPEIEEPALLEHKTHGDKSFQKLKKEGLQKSKPQHYKQMQTYMPFLQVKIGLYCAVNKNDDELYFELVHHDPEVSRAIVDKAESIIFGEGMPPRISDSPAWYVCQWCNFKDVCFLSKTPMVNCRTCKYSRPERDGTWSCALRRSEITVSPMQGCDQHLHKFEHETSV